MEKRVVGRYLRTLTADLSPPLGVPGGPCYVVQRIDQEVSNERTKTQLIDKAERGESITNPEAATIYDLESEQGAGIAKRLMIGPHAQYRMDLRQVTVAQVRAALQSWSKLLNDFKSQRHPRYDDYAKKMARGEAIEYTDNKSNLTIVFAFHGRDAVKLVSTWWHGVPDPKAPKNCRL